MILIINVLFHHIYEDMYMRIMLLTALSLAGFATLNPALAAEKYEFDKAHTQILFFVSHLGFSMSEGEFLEYDGELIIDRENPENSSVDVTIQTESIDMDHEKWEEHMKNEDFFHVTEFPTMTFESTNVEVTGENTAQLTGDLTLLGTTNPVTLDVVHNKSGENPFSGKYIAGFSATGQLLRSEFGMDYGLPGIGDEVEIRLEVEAIRKDQE